MAKRTPQPCTPENCGSRFPKCGKRGTYVGGCRCDACAEANRSRLAAIPAGKRGECSAGNCGDNYSVCGTNSTYTGRKCRCDACMAAHRLYVNKLNARVQPKNFGPCSRSNCGDVYPKCGNATTYNNQKIKCRCDACAAAANTSGVQRKKERRTRLGQRNFGPCSAQNCGDVFAKCGDLNTYTNLMCRCDVCKDKSAEVQRVRYQDDPLQIKAAKHARRARIAGVLNIPYTSEQLAQKYAYWGNACHIQGRNCKGTADDIEHVIPVDRKPKGGPNILANIRPACKTCNSEKGPKWPYPIPYIPGGKVA